MLNTKEISDPGRHLVRWSRFGRLHLIGSGPFILICISRWSMAEASPAPARACEPPEAAVSADPRAALKAHLYAMANNAFELQLHREFPKYKTMLKGWDGQQFIWQKRNKAVMAQHFGVTVEDLRAEWDAAKRRFQKNRAAELSRDRTNKHNKDQALALWKVSPSVKSIRCLLILFAQKKKGLETQLRRKDDSILSEATNSHLNLSIQHFIHEIQLQTAASSASVRKSRTLVLARIDKRRYY